MTTNNLIDKELIKKYNIAGPRYTSYPTMPYWETEKFIPENWENYLDADIKKIGNQKYISIYIHLPFCERLCTYCGCNTRITINHANEKPYIKALLKEWAMYVEKLGSDIQINELHLGGGTPTFFSPENLSTLINGIKSKANFTKDAALSFEGHPNNTTKEHLETLFDLGFRRVSFGIQDFDEEVQRIINRIQPLENVQSVVSEAREIGYTSINFDLIYGLPKQTIETIDDTFNKCIALKPDRIAYYSYAHVPWVKPGQRSYSEIDLPTNEYKLSLFNLGKEKVLQAAYEEIGMDHFALPNDAMAISAKNGTLHRNFMGYTDMKNNMLIGLGVSSIGDTFYSFYQNHKKLEDYYKAIEKNEFPVFKGHLQSPEDLFQRELIMQVMCSFKVKFNQEYFPIIKQRLTEALNDGLIKFEGETALQITPKGRPFVRNIAMAFDERLWRKQPSSTIFSSTI